MFLINRDPFRAIRRGRQLFQRKFTPVEGPGPTNSDGRGDINATPSAPASPTVAPDAMAAHAAQPAAVATSPPVLTAAMRHIFSASA